LLVAAIEQHAYFVDFDDGADVTVLPIVEAILEATHNDPRVLNAVDEAGDTPLTVAISEGYIDLAKILVRKYKAWTNVPDSAHSPSVVYTTWVNDPDAPRRPAGAVEDSGFLEELGQLTPGGADARRMLPKRLGGESPPAKNRQPRRLPSPRPIHRRMLKRQNKKKKPRTRLANGRRKSRPGKGTGCCEICRVGSF